jgi:hypothetical protein
MEDQLDMDDDILSSIEDVKKDETTDPAVGNIAAHVRDRFKKAAEVREADEQRWMRAYRNYRGIYDKSMQFTSTEKSRVFVKITKTKVNAAYAQITEVLFGNNRFPLSINPTILPEGIKESVYIETNPQTGGSPPAPGMPSGGPESAAEGPQGLLPGETYQEFKSRLGALTKKLDPVKDSVKDGPGTGPTQVPFYPAMVTAKKMEKKIHDQIDESDGKKHLRSTAFECALLGTGAMKGPFVVDKEYPSWTDGGDYAPFVKASPNISHVSIWNLYPDPDATNMTDAEYIIERHKMPKSQLRALKRRPHFRANKIDLAIQYGENYQPEWWEQEMEDFRQQGPLERYEVLEFWGYVDVEFLEQEGVKVPKELKGNEQVSVNIWTCNDQVIRFVLNPFKPSYLPYYCVPYELNPYSFFGIGVAENMDDTQTIMNGFMRMSIDNAALSGNLLIEVDEDNLAPGQDLTVYPGKVFRRSGGAPGQAIFGTKFPNVAQENMQMFDKARQLADESTGFPSFAHGQTGVTGVGRTASGISMLMSAAHGAIRAVIKNFDDYLLGPLGKSLYYFNMQFDFDPELQGDFEVKAEGTESLMANEVRSQRLMQFLGIVQNPVLAPFAKMDYIIREIAKSMDLDPDKVANSMGEAAIQAELLKKFQQPPPELAPGQAPGAPVGAIGGAPGGPPGPPGGPKKPPAGAQAADPQGSGGGNIGTGSVPPPGVQGFAGNTGSIE